MDFRILGPLEVHDGDRALSLGGRQQRQLLAILLLRANEVVPVERIVDELWRDAPPLTATKSVQALVSRLRRTLEGEPSARNGEPRDDGVVLSRPHGYLLRLAPGELDLDRFESLLEGGRRELAAARAEEASSTLGEALALWRGPPLAEFAHDSFAQAEIARLEELRSSALEERIEADLALGGSAEVVAEVEALVAANPLRERLRGQLMLALYRSGRQAEALETYQETRRLLIDQLGIEPSPALQRLERAILLQDESLEPPLRIGAEHERSVRRGVVLVGVAVLAAAAALTALLATRGEPSPEIHVLANSIAVIDPASNRVERQIAVGARPAFVTYGKPALWVANLDDNSVQHVDPRTDRVVRTIATDASAGGIALGAGSLWVANSGAATVSRIDPKYDRVVQTIAVHDPIGFPVGSLAFGAHAVWVVNSAGTVSRLDPATGAVAATIVVGGEPSAIAFAARGVWVASHRNGTVTRIDPIGPADAVTTTIAVGDGPTAIAGDSEAIWVANGLADTISRIDPETNAVTATIPVGRRPSGVAVGSGAVWVANEGAGTVSRIDPRKNAVVKTIRVGSNSPTGVAAGRGSIWVTVQGSAPRAPSVAAARSGGSARFNIESGFDYTDPALAYFFASWELEYATCAKLLNYPDRAGPAGSRLVPEVAESLPAVSAGGRRYTFRIRDGFRFSPPSNQRVTAATFKYAIERSLSPKLGGAAKAQLIVGDIVGENKYRAGRAEHIAGVMVSGNTLTIELTRAARDFPARIALPFFCAVPVGLPPDQRGLRAIPSAGPYYVSSYTPKQQIVLTRNPNYRGPRPHRLDEIVYTLGVAKTRTVAQIEGGQVDYAPDGIPPGAAARLAARYGASSPAAQAGRQRYFAEPLLGLWYLALNTSRPLFADVNLRKAVNYAIDRHALLRQEQPVADAGEPTDQYLPPGMPGFADAHIYPLSRPDLATARRLAHGRHGRAVFYTCDTAVCSRRAQMVRSNLKAIGIDVEIKQFPQALLDEKVGTRGEPFDIVDAGWLADYADPFSLLDNLLDGNSIKPRTNNNLAYFDQEPYNRKLEAASTLAGRERYRVYGKLDVDLARNAAPLVAIANKTTRDFFSARIGCHLHQPVYGVDLAALCVKRASR